MRKLCILLALIFLISGCANMRLENRSNQEKAAAVAAGVDSKNKCFDGKAAEMLPRSKAIQAEKCVLNIINSEIVPFAVYPDLYMIGEGDALRNAEAYQNGKISKTEWLARRRDRYARIVAIRNQRLRADYRVNEAQVQEGLNDLNRQLQYQQMINAANRPVQTYCQPNGNGYSCTSD